MRYGMQWLAARSVVGLGTKMSVIGESSGSVMKAMKKDDQQSDTQMDGSCNYSTAMKKLMGK